MVVNGRVEISACELQLKKPYWIVFNETKHLLLWEKRYQKWVTRFRRPSGSSHYQESTIVVADDGGMDFASGLRISLLKPRSRLFAETDWNAYCWQQA